MSGWTAWLPFSRGFWENSSAVESSIYLGMYIYVYNLLTPLEGNIKCSLHQHPYLDFRPFHTQAQQLNRKAPKQ